MNKAIVKDARPTIVIAGMSLFLWLFVGTLPVLASLQNRPTPDDPSEDIRSIQQAIESGNGEKIAGFAGSYVQVSVAGETSLHSRAQTAYILKAFFRDYPPADFAFERRMRLGKDWFIYGEYRPRGANQSYRIEVLLRWTGNRYELKTISFEQNTR